MTVADLKAAEDQLQHELISFWQTVEIQVVEQRLHIAKQYQTDFDRLDKELPNLRPTLEWFAIHKTGSSTEIFLDYVKALNPYLRTRGFNQDLLNWCNTLIEKSRSSKDIPAWLYLTRSDAHNALGQWGEAETDIKTTLDLSPAGSNLWAKSTFYLGRLHLNQGNYGKALKILGQSEEYFKQKNDLKNLAMVRSEIAAYHLNVIHLDKALSIFKEVEGLAKQLDDFDLYNHSLLMLGVVYRRLREYDKAKSYLNELLDRAVDAQNPNGTATSLHHLAWVYINEGNRVEALHLCGKAIDLYNKINDQRGLSDAYEQLALIEFGEGEPESALEHLEHSLLLRRQIGNQHGVASCLRHIATIKIKTGDWVSGIKSLSQSLLIYWRLEALGRRRLTAIFKKLIA